MRTKLSKIYLVNRSPSCICRNSPSAFTPIIETRKMSGLKSCLLENVSDPVCISDNKISVIGVGQVGMACATSIISQNISSEVALADSESNKLQGELLDLQHGSAFIKVSKVSGSTDFAITAGSKICIVTAGARQLKGETRLDLVHRNTDIFKCIIPQLVKHSPNCILLIVTNPVDVLTYVAWKVSGLPKTRVIGSGTNLDSSRLRYFMSQKLGVATSSCHGWVIGEHGDSSVPVWSGVNVAGVRLRELEPRLGKPKDPEHWDKLHEQVVKSAYEVIRLKGYTSWAIALSVASICNAIINNSGTVHAVSTYIKGLHSIEDNICLSLPCVLGENGVTDIIRQNLTHDELDKLHKSAKVISKAQKDIKI